MHSTDAGAGEHCISCFRNHRQIDGDAVALFDALAVQHVGELVHLAVQFLVGDDLVLVGVVAFPDDRGLVAALFQVAVNAVGRNVERAVLEPFDRNVVIVVGSVLHLGERLDPVHPFAVLTPEAIGVFHGTLIHFLIFGIVDMRPRGNLRGNGKYGLSHVKPPRNHNWTCGKRVLPSAALFCRGHYAYGPSKRPEPRLGTLVGESLVYGKA